MLANEKQDGYLNDNNKLYASIWKQFLAILFYM